MESGPGQGRVTRMSGPATVKVPRPSSCAARKATGSRMTDGRASASRIWRPIARLRASRQNPMATRSGPAAGPARLLPGAQGGAGGQGGRLVCLGRVGSERGPDGHRRLVAVAFDASLLVVSVVEGGSAMRRALTVPKRSIQRSCCLRVQMNGSAQPLHSGSWSNVGLLSFRRDLPWFQCHLRAAMVFLPGRERE
jgi:hypothetical protein